MSSDCAKEKRSPRSSREATLQSRNAQDRAIKRPSHRQQSLEALHDRPYALEFINHRINSKSGRHGLAQ